MMQQGTPGREGIVVGILFAALLVLMWYKGHKGPSTLVVYVYHPRTDDVEYTNNVKYFIREGIQVSGCCPFLHEPASRQYVRAADTHMFLGAMLLPSCRLEHK
jgi:hypothetical protein